MPARKRPSRPPPPPRKPPRKRPDPKKSRVRNLLALDALNLMRRVARRHDQMVELFGQKRDRTALLDPLQSWFPTVTFRELVLFAPAEQQAISRFYEAVDALRWYLRHTNDMPGTLRSMLDAHRRDLEDAYRTFDIRVGTPAAAPEPEDAADLIAHAGAARQRRPTK